jgi:sugar lactone lactonase YvrE
VTRSNDGRADPWGGFWIGTMGKGAERGAGAIYRYYRGELRRLVSDVTISNAISFTPDAGFACFSDTMTGRVMRWALDEATGWPVGEAGVFLDLRAERLNPDGAVFDADGRFWVAQWGAGRVAAYDGEGGFLRAVSVGAAHSTCPAFGGPEMRTLFCTSALQGLTPEQIAAAPESGMTFAVDDVAKGQSEPAVIL